MKKGALCALWQPFSSFEHVKQKPTCLERDSLFLGARALDMCMSTLLMLPTWAPPLVCCSPSTCYHGSIMYHFPPFALQVPVSIMYHFPPFALQVPVSIMYHFPPFALQVPGWWRSASVTSGYLRACKLSAQTWPTASWRLTLCPPLCCMDCCVVWLWAWPRDGCSPCARCATACSLQPRPCVCWHKPGMWARWACALMQGCLHARACRSSVPGCSL